jgi:hypothetical protein
MHGRKSARSRFGRANVGGSPLGSVEAVFRQDEGGGRRGKAEARWCDVFVAILVKPGPMTAGSPRSSFSPTSQFP